MLTAYDQYKQSHAALFLAKNIQEIYLHASATVENYLQNRAIWNELNHYKTTGQVLGHHPLFSWMKRREQLRNLKVGELFNRKTRLENNLVRNRAAVRKQPQGPLARQRKQRILAMEEELAEINRMINH